HQLAEVTGGRWQARDRFEVRNLLEPQPAFQVHPGLVMRDDPQTLEWRCTSLPPVNRLIPAPGEIHETGSICASVFAIELLHAFRERAGYETNVVRVRLHMGIALRVNIALRTIDAAGCIEALHVHAGFEVAIATGRYVAVIGLLRSEEHTSEL